MTFNFRSKHVDAFPLNNAIRLLSSNPTPKIQQSDPSMSPASRPVSFGLFSGTHELNVVAA